MAKRVLLYDATLREGAQAAGVSFSLSGRLRVARALDRMGFDYLEGPFAAANPAGDAFYAALAREPLSRAKLVAFAMTCRAGERAEDDPLLAAAAAAGTPAVAVVGKAARRQWRSVLKVSAAENLRMVAESVAFLKAAGKEVFFEAEHFFAGFREDPDSALLVLAAAADAGADCLVLCDTKGAAMPRDVAKAVEAAKGAGVAVAIHAHNDCGLAVANTLAALEAGALVAQGTVNGYGERAGGADECTLLPLLSLHGGFTARAVRHAGRLTALSRLVDEATGQRPDPRRPFVGSDVFTHKAGLHVDAVLKAPETLEAVPPEAVGNRRRLVVSDLAGTRATKTKAKEMGVSLAAESAKRILERIEAFERDGYVFEGADASFRLLLEKELGRHEPFFELKGFSVAVQRQEGKGTPVTVATVKVAVGGESEITAGEGVGPVDALNEAFRRALVRFYPAAGAVVLEDYNVRILDPETGTGAKTRVRIDSSDGVRHWGTVGVSDNIIEASWQALADGFEYKLLLDKEAAAARRAGKTRRKR